MKFNPNNHPTIVMHFTEFGERKSFRSYNSFRYKRDAMAPEEHEKIFNLPHPIERTDFKAHFEWFVEYAMRFAWEPDVIALGDHRANLESILRRVYEKGFLDQENEKSMFLPLVGMMDPILELVCASVGTNRNGIYYQLFRLAECCVCYEQSSLADPLEIIEAFCARIIDKFTLGSNYFYAESTLVDKMMKRLDEGIKAFYPFCKDLCSIVYTTKVRKSLDSEEYFPSARFYLQRKWDNDNDRDFAAFLANKQPSTHISFPEHDQLLSRLEAQAQAGIE